MRCESQPGRTRFEVRLPVLHDDADGAAAAPASVSEGVRGDRGRRGERELAMGRREVIVCVDDEEGVLRVLRAQLGARFGHECQITTARSGDEAIALFDELSREGESIALVIADQIMPGMKGVELLEIVDRRLPSTTKILLTGQAGLDAVVEAINRTHLNQYNRQAVGRGRAAARGREPVAPVPPGPREPAADRLAVGQEPGAARDEPRASRPRSTSAPTSSPRPTPGSPSSRSPTG